MKRPAQRLAALALGLILAPLLGAADLGQITHLRVGGHRGYDRLVIEVDRAVKVWWGVETDPRAPIFELAARPLRPQILDTGLARAGVMRIESMPTGTRIRLDARKRRVRVFMLEDPHRVVIDFADLGNKPFTAPKGTRSVAMDQERFSVATSTPKAPAASTPKRSAQRSPFEAPKDAPQPLAAPTKPPGAQAAKQPVVAPSDGPPSSKALDTTAEAIARPTPESPTSPTLPVPTTAPERSTSAGGAAATRPSPPRPTPGASSGGRPDWWLLLAVAFGLIAVICLIYGLMRRPSAARTPVMASAADPMLSPETITPEELFRAGGRIELLEKRLDEEVRARMVLEERGVQANEEIKVLRDKLARLERQR